MKKYALYDKKNKNYIGFYARSNPPDGECNDVEYILTTSDGSIWLTNTREHAEWVIKYSTDWYNAGYETPSHTYNPNDLEVREIDFPQ